LSITTGLRSGEVLAIRKSDIGEKTLHVRHSWNWEDKLKTPKNGEAREVPLLPEAREKLSELLAENPFGNDDPFVFFGLREDALMNSKILLDGLKAACAGIKVRCRERNIVFHSHRYYYAARMVDKMIPEQVSRITGHKGKAVFEEYADHVISKNLDQMRAAGSEVFGNILKTGKAA
jgi:integrase